MNKLILILIFITYSYSAEFINITKNVNIFMLKNVKNIIENQQNFIKLKIENHLNYSLTSKNDYYLSYHLFDKNKKLISWDNIRTSFNIKANEKKVLKLNIDSLVEGNYFIQVDIVKEGSFWSGYKKLYPIEVKNYFENYHICTENDIDTCWHIDKEESLNKLGFIINKTIKKSEIYFPKTKIYGFSAGSGYNAQIWIRDSYTILQYSKYLYKEPFLSNWLIYFLNHKKDNGLIYDWFDNHGRFDKNTVETDQESSLILAYFELLSIDRNKYINKLKEIEELCINVIKEKQDTKTGLIMNAHTIDWGDVQYGANTWINAVHLNDNSYFVVGTYNNALFYSALEKLVNEYKTSNNKKFLKWSKIKNRLKININKYLWNDEKGFYRLHNHIASLKHSFNEDNIFGMGGNAIALSTTLVNEKMKKSIIHTARQRQNIFNFSTISGVLLPPYPKNYYAFSAVNDYFEYQNGGQWDWFGGRLIKSMFQNGFDVEAYISLKEIAQKTIKNKGIYEWDTVDGKGKGSSNFTGAAGVLGNTVVEGLFGISIDNDKLLINSKILWKKKKKFILNLNMPSVNKKIIYSFDGQCYTVKYKGFKEVNFLGSKQVCFKQSRF
jgi:hypothetical protein